MSKRDCDTCQGTEIIYIWDPRTKRKEATTCPVCKGTGEEMRVYILDNGDYPEDREIVGVFDSPEKAVKYLLDHPEKFYKNPGAYSIRRIPSIQEWTVQ